MAGRPQPAAAAAVIAGDAAGIGGQQKARRADLRQRQPGGILQPVGGGAAAQGQRAGDLAFGIEAPAAQPAAGGLHRVKRGAIRQPPRRQRRRGAAARQLDRLGPADPPRRVERVAQPRARPAGFQHQLWLSAHLHRGEAGEAEGGLPIIETVIQLCRGLGLQVPGGDPAAAAGGGIEPRAGPGLDQRQAAQVAVQQRVAGGDMGGEGEAHAGSCRGRCGAGGHSGSAALTSRQPARAPG